MEKEDIFDQQQCIESTTCVARRRGQVPLPARCVKHLVANFIKNCFIITKFRIFVNVSVIPFFLFFNRSDQNQFLLIFSNSLCELRKRRVHENKRLA